MCARFANAALVAMIVAHWGASSAPAQVTGKDGVEDVKGARWAYEITDENGSMVAKGVFRVNEKVMYKGKAKVGVINAQGRTETTLMISGIPEINGKATLKKVGEKPRVWEGQLERKKGKKFKMKVTFRDA